MRLHIFKALAIVSQTILINVTGLTQFVSPSTGTDGSLRSLGSSYKYSYAVDGSKSTKFLSYSDNIGEAF